MSNVDNRRENTMTLKSRYAGALALALLGLPPWHRRTRSPGCGSACSIASGPARQASLSAPSPPCTACSSPAPAAVRSATSRRCAASASISAAPLRTPWRGGCLRRPSNWDAASLAGVYGGVTGAAVFIIGGSANVLVGGSNNTFALQPLSVQGATGVNVAAGVAGLQLQAVPDRVRRRHRR